MDGGGIEAAHEPEELGRLFLERANARDVDGLALLYESDATLATPDGVIAGVAAIRAFYERLLARGTSLAGEVRPALRVGDLALTSTRFAGGVTVEVARRQPDGTWRWVIDQPDVLR